MKCPNCGHVWHGKQKTKTKIVPMPVHQLAKLHRETIAKYADGTRTLQQIADCMNADEEFCAIGLPKRTAANIMGGIQQARKHGLKVATFHSNKPHRDNTPFWIEWVTSSPRLTFKAMGLKMGVSGGRANYILYREHLRQVENGVWDEVKKRIRTAKQIEIFLRNRERKREIYRLRQEKIEKENEDFLRRLCEATIPSKTSDPNERPRVQWRKIVTADGSIGALPEKMADEILERYNDSNRYNKPRRHDR